MAWTAKVLQADKFAGMAIVEFTDGTNIYTQQFNNLSSLDQLKRYVEDKINSLKSFDTVAFDTSTDLTIAQPVVAQEVIPVVDADKQTYFADLEQLRKTKDLVDLGVLPVENAEYTSLQAKVQNEFKSEYLS